MDHPHIRYNNQPLFLYLKHTPTPYTRSVAYCTPHCTQPPTTNHFLPRTSFLHTLLTSKSILTSLFCANPTCHSPPVTLTRPSRSYRHLISYNNTFTRSLSDIPAPSKYLLKVCAESKTSAHRANRSSYQTLSLMHEAGACKHKRSSFVGIVCAFFFPPLPPPSSVSPTFSPPASQTHTHHIFN